MSQWSKTHAVDRAANLHENVFIFVVPVLRCSKNEFSNHPKSSRIYPKCPPRGGPIRSVSIKENEKVEAMRHVAVITKGRGGSLPGAASYRPGQAGMTPSVAPRDLRTLPSGAGCQLWACGTHLGRRPKRVCHPVEHAGRALRSLAPRTLKASQCSSPGSVHRQGTHIP